MVCHVRLRHQKKMASFLVVSLHSMGTERVVSHHNKLKSIQRASLSNETVSDRLIISVMVLVLRATIPDQLLLLSCRKRIAAIESHRLMYINRDISFENFLELTRVYNFSIRPRHCSVYTVTLTILFVICYMLYVILCTNNNS